MRLRFSDRLFILFSYSFVVSFAFFCFLPFWLMITGSVTAEKELILNGYSLLPQELSFKAYEVLFQSNKLFQTYGNTVFITITGVILALTVSSMLAYSIANRRNLMRNGIAFLVYFTMLFNGGIVPIYILISSWLQLSDSLWSIILPLAVQPFFIFLLVSFFRTFPEELEEAAKMDGAHEMTIFLRLVLPISMPILATVGLFYSLSYWNDWFMGLLFINDEHKYPLQLMLRRLVSNIDAAKSLMPAGASYIADVPSLGIRMATTIITIGPIILLYPFIQRYFVKGLTLGAVKG